MNTIKARFFAPPKNQIKLHFRRLELKFLLTFNQYLSLRLRISRHLTLDPFAGDLGYYQISSIYFDTANLTSYLHSKAGLRHRIKFRLRQYTHQSQPSNTIFWELKRKIDATVIKDRGVSSPLETEKLLQQISTPTPDPTIQKFLQAKRRYLLKPKILLRYRREPFLGPTQDLRITFDHHIDVTPVNLVEFKASEGKNILSKRVIMELKFACSLPHWVGEIIGEYNLERIRVSKYSLGIEATKSHLTWITP